MLFCFGYGSLVRIEGSHSVSGVQTVNQGCCWTQMNVVVWKPKQMRIWVSTENSRGPEIRPDGGRHGTSSFHAGLRLTEKEKDEKKWWWVKTKAGRLKVRKINVRDITVILYWLVKTIRRMMAMSMKRNWKSPRLLEIWEGKTTDGTDQRLHLNRI